MYKHRGGIRIEARGLTETIKALKDIDREIPREFKRGLKEDARPILKDARSNAMSIARTGAYASSMAMRAISNGVKIVSSDPGAGAIEFAHHGAVYQKGSRRGKPIGVPSGEPPRALVRSVLDNEALVTEAVETRIEQTIKRYLNG